jgi:phosphoglycolate phosphatase-like HAD superfamily hydrolase
VAADAMEQLRRHVGGDFPQGRIWVIGDTPHDIACAKHIGARVLAVATGNHPRAELEAAQPDVLLDDLRDVDRVLRLIEP